MMVMHSLSKTPTLEKEVIRRLVKGQGLG
jgi:hypothetical protein